MGTKQQPGLRGWRGLGAGALVVTALLALTACEDGTGVELPEVRTVVVGPTGRSVAAGDTIRFSATARDAAGTPIEGVQVLWMSSDENVATVSGRGVTALVTAKAAGSVLISARVGERTGSTQLSVTQAPPVAVAIRITPDGASLKVGERVTLEGSLRTADDEIVSGPALTWTSGTPSIAVVEESGTPGRIVVHALEAGTVTITARSAGLENGVQLVVTDVVGVGALEMRPGALIVETGSAQTIVVHAWGPDGSWLEEVSVAWTSQDTTIAKVGGTGRSARIVGVREGITKVVAAGVGTSAEATVTVRNAPYVERVIVNPSAPTAWVGSLVRLRAHVIAPGGHVYVGYPVAWSVEDTAIATVEADGLVHARQAGTTRVFARSGGKQGETLLRVHATPAGTITFDLAPVEGPWGDFRPLVHLGDTVWTSPSGTTHQARQFLIGGNLVMDMTASTWTQSLRVELLADLGAGFMRVAVKTRDDHGTLTWGLFQPWHTFFQSSRHAGVTFEGTMPQPGRMALQQTLSGTSVRDYLWILR